EPARRMRQLATKTGFVNDQDRRVHNAVGKPRQCERPITLPSAHRQQPVRAGDILQILDDNAAVIDRAFVRQDETWHLAEGILLSQRIIFVKRVSGNDRDACAHAECLDRHANLAAEWRRRRRAQYEVFRSGHTNCLMGYLSFSVCTPASAITFAHFLVSLSMKLRKSSGVSPTSMAPWLASFSITVGSLMASTAALLSAATTC